MPTKASVSRAAALGLTLAAVIGVTAAPAADAPPMKMPHGEQNALLATAGDYTLDSQHVGIIASVSHVGFSRSIFRFNVAEGSLKWDPKAPSKSSLKVTVKPGSIATNVDKFAEELSGEKYLNAGAFPDATFVSTKFTRIDATHGKVAGDFTLMGKTRPVVFDVSLVGAGSFFGQTRLGVHAVTSIKGTDYGLNPMFAAPIELTIDAEFFKGVMKYG
jgi:polyisoprenoid-binding protein YceI